MSKHAQVAERFRFFMEARNLNNQQFLSGIDGAITTSSLFSILNGHRQPSKALAVLIEKIWGFKANFLLQGEGGMWAPSSEDHAGLSSDEAHVLNFMRRSVANARDIKGTMEKSELWSALYARTQRTLATLEETDPNQPDYARLCKLAFGESRWIASAFGKFTELFHDRRVLRLSILFVNRFLLALPEKKLDATQFATIQGLIQPVLEKMQQDMTNLEQSIANQRKTLENLCQVSLPQNRLPAPDDYQILQEHLARLAHELNTRNIDELTPTMTVLERVLRSRPKRNDDLASVTRQIIDDLHLGLSQIRSRDVAELEDELSVL